MSEAARTPVGSTYGGQALIEGVMIRGQTCVSIAVRRPNGEILVETQPIGWRWARTIRRIPFIRGVIVLSEMLVVGTRALIFSANIAAEEEDEDEEQSRPRNLRAAAPQKILVTRRTLAPRRRTSKKVPLPLQRKGQAACLRGRLLAPLVSACFLPSVSSSRLPSLRRD